MCNASSFCCLNRTEKVFIILWAVVKWVIWYYVNGCHGLSVEKLHKRQRKIATEGVTNWTDIDYQEEIWVVDLSYSDQHWLDLGQLYIQSQQGEGLLTLMFSLFYKKANLKILTLQYIRYRI